MDPHTHKIGSPEGQVSEKDLIPNGTILGALPASGLEGEWAVIDDGVIRFYRYIKGAWRELRSGDRYTISTNFDHIDRYETSVSGGAASVSNLGGLLLSPNNGAGNYAQAKWNIGVAANLALYKIPFTLTMIVEPNNIAVANGEGDFFCGVGVPTIGASGITFTPSHVGFKFLKRSGSISLYATQADGTTETASSALSTVSTEGNVYELRIEFTLTAVSYYFIVNRSDNSSWSAPTILTANIPTSNANVLAFSATNRNTAFNYNFVVSHAALTR